MSDKNTTDVLKGNLDDDDNVRWLMERFRDSVRKVIESRIPSNAKSKYDVAEAIETTLRNSLNAAKKDEFYRTSSEAFRGLVLRIARRKRADQLKELGSEKRDVSREVQASGEDGIGFEVADLKQLGPDEIAELNELLEIRIRNLRSDSTDPVRQEINLLAVSQGMNAREISEHLQGRPEGFKVPSIPTIRAQIERALAIDRTTIEDYCKES